MKYVDIPQILAIPTLKAADPLPHIRVKFKETPPN